MAMLLGKKIGMTQVYNDEGRTVPVTVIQAGPCKVLQVKTNETDGYNAVQLGYDEVKNSRVRKPQEGHCKKADSPAKKFIREMRLGSDQQSELEVGSEINVDVFAETKFVDVVGTSIGKGYAGVMKRHGFGGFPASHGCERHHRAPGSIASHATNAGTGGNVKKGKRMAGRMGGARVSTRNHALVSIDQEKNLVVVKGSIPGPSGGYVVIKTSKTHKNS